MVGKTIVVLGGGMGGLAVANQLRRLLPGEHRVVVVEREASFFMRPFSIRLMAGEMKDRREGERDLSALARKGIEWQQADVLEIEPESRRVRTSAGTLEADYLIIALGTERDTASIPGFAKSAHNLYEPDGALRLHEALNKFGGGKAVVLITRAPFSCPAAPYEAAFLMDAAFRKKGTRRDVEIAFYTPEPRPMAAAGPDMGEAVIAMLKDRDIAYHPQHRVRSIDAGSGKIVFENAEAPFDLLVGVPPHTAPKVVREAGLTDETGWVPVNLETLETSHPGVYALGDVTSIRQPNPTGMFLPKAWVFADEESRVIAKNIAAQVISQEGLSKFDGSGFCYVEVGDGLAAYGSGNFYAYPAARVYMEAPSTRHHEERKRIELEQLETLL